MRLLLDTRVLLWWLGKSPRLHKRAAAAIRDSANDVYVSAVSAVEISVKVAQGRLKAPDDLEQLLADRAMTPLPVTIRHGMAMRELPPHHDDPFDRILIAQARCEELVLVTADPAIPVYDVPVLLAEAAPH